MYKVKEVYYTIQGEGAHAGQPAVFCRFTGCNLWSGREEDRSSAICNFCDTDFVGTDGVNGGRYEAEELASLIVSLWPSEARPVWVVFTGGEPLLQLDDELIKVCSKAGIFMAIETNGTIEVPDGLDWVCVSPKAGSKLIVTKGNELKLVYPQQHLDPSNFEQMKFDVFSLQPMDNAQKQDNTTAAIEYCKLHPKWRLSIQLHKEIGIP